MKKENLSGKSFENISGGKSDSPHRYDGRHPDIVDACSLPFSVVFSDEKSAIFERRRALLDDAKKNADQKSAGKASSVSRLKPDLKKFNPDDEGPDVAVEDFTGLALSGGGIRSAAFCLGVTQALWAFPAKRAVAKSAAGKNIDFEGNLFQQLDYLSTVSGGGYTGTGISVSMKKANGSFPYPSLLKKTEAPVLRHIRDHSNYLFPRGLFRDLLPNLASYIRGIAANIPLVLFFLSTAICLTLFSKPSLEKLSLPSIFAIEFPVSKDDWLAFANPFIGTQGHFRVTLAMLGALALVLVCWSFVRSWINRPHQEWKTIGTRIIVSLMVLLGLTFVFELQPKVINGLFSSNCRQIVAAPFSGAEKIPDYELACRDLAARSAKRDKEETDNRSIELITKPFGEEGAQNGLAKAGSSAMEILAAKKEQPNQLGAQEAVPPRPSGLSFQTVVEWIKNLTIYIGSFTAFFAAVRGVFGSGEASQAKSGGPLGILGNYSSKFAQILAGLLLPLLLYLAYLYASYWSMGIDLEVFLENNALATDQSHIVSPMAPGWYQAMMGFLPQSMTPAGFYGILSLLCLCLILLLQANNNSPHNLYRDRLATAFMRYAPGSSEKKEDIKDGSSLKLSGLAKTKGPFHLINAALNIQGSAKVNGRGRNAGFFTFSQNYCGSYETGFVHTKDLELAERSQFTLSSAMAVSAAAASAAMGSQTMRPLAATLALLNVRLGYWMVNPVAIARRFRTSGEKGLAHGEMANILTNNSLALFMRELTGGMKETKDLIYLSDGGHIENLGLYTLLARRCKFIIVVDGEADPELSFSSFVTAQRYARIDLGTRIDLPVDKLRQHHLAVRKELTPLVLKRAEKEPLQDLTSTHGPHCAIGTIYYPDNENGKKQVGVLLYVKTTMSGDENDYIRDYARRYRNFPHETTGDQFFSEEQFEAYRALGFHAINNALKGRDVVQSPQGLIKLTDEIGNEGEKAERRKAVSDENPLTILRSIFPDLDKKAG